MFSSSSESNGAGIFVILGVTFLPVIWRGKAIQHGRASRHLTESHSVPA